MTMATSDELFMLVKTASHAQDADIIKVVRVYLSARRAEEDRELLEEADKIGCYRVDAAPYIDN